jgi:hypothetical protein
VNVEVHIPPALDAAVAAVPGVCVTVAIAGAPGVPKVGC